MMTIALEIVIIMRRISEPETLGPEIAMVVITTFYIGILELLLMPIKVAVEKRITEFMEEDA